MLVGNFSILVVLFGLYKVFAFLMCAAYLHCISKIITSPNLCLLKQFPRINYIPPINYICSLDNFINVT